MLNVRKLVLVGLAAVLTAGCSQPSADELFTKGNEYYDQDLVPEAIVQYRMAVQADPMRGDVRAKLAEAYFRSKDGASALREAVLAADLLPNDVKSQVRAGNLLVLASQFDDAKERAKKALALDAKNVDAMVLMGNALALLKDLDGAISEYQDALVINPAGDQIYASIGAIQSARGQKAEAEATFRKALAVAPKSVPARLALASFLWSNGAPNGAEVVLKEALAIDPSSLQVNRALGVFYMATNQAPKAEPYFQAIATTTKTDQAQLAMADYYLATARPDDAHKILTPLSEKADFFAPASLRLASIEIGRKNFTVANRIVLTVLERSPKYAPARVLALRLLLLDNELDLALTNARALVKDEATSSAAAAEGYLVIGNIEASRDRSDEAVKAYQEALRIRPDSVPVGLALAQLHLRVRNPDRAETFARTVLGLDPKNPTARAIIVRVELMRNNMARAATELASLEKDYPNSLMVMNLVATRHLAAGRLDAAAAKYRQVAEAAPDNLEALEGLINVDLRSNRKKEAAARVDAALKRSPASADLFVMAAATHGRTGNLPRAEELLKQAIEREPARMLAYNMLGQLYMSQNRLADASVQFQKLLERNPRSVAANTMLGMLFEAQRDLPAAEAQYRKTLSVDQSAAVAANNLAWIYVSSNRNLDEALQLATTALKSLPEEPHVNDTAGWIYYKKGLFLPAIRHLELSIARDASDPTTHYHLGVSYVLAGELEKAKKALARALTMSTTFDGAEEAKKALASLLR